MSKLGAPSPFLDRLRDLMAHKGLSLERLATLLEVAEAGGISAAAPDNSNQQSLMSRQLSELEQFFGLQLTVRTGRRLQLTEDGLSLAQHARWLFQGLADLRDKGRESSHSPLVFGAGDTILQFLVIPALTRLGSEHRFILKTLANEQIERQLIDGSLQLGVLRGQPTSDRLVARRVGRWEWALAVPTALTRPGDTAESVLLRCPLALQSSEPQFVADVLDDLGPSPLALRCDTFAQALQAVRSGKYVSVLPRVMLRDLPEITMFPTLESRGIDLYLAFPPQGLLARPTLASAIDAIDAAFRDT